MKTKKTYHPLQILAWTNHTRSARGIPILYTVALFMAFILLPTTRAFSQIIPSSAYSETIISSLGATSTDDVSVNCDMYQDNAYGQLKTVAWSIIPGPGSSMTQQSWFYVEDGAGHSVIVNIPGMIEPDIVFASENSIPGTAAQHQVYLVYHDGSGNLYLDIYDLQNIGMPSFGVQSYLAAVPPNTWSGIGSPGASLISSSGGADGAGHIDMWMNPSGGPFGQPTMNKYVAVWAESGVLMTMVNDVVSPLLSPPTPIWITLPGGGTSALSNVAMPDVAAFKQSSVPATGLVDERAVVVYQNTGGPSLDLLEFNFTTTAPLIFTLDPGAIAYSPRVEAMSVFDSTGGSAPPQKWQVASCIQTGSSPITQAVYGYNNLTTGPTSISGVLSSFYASWPSPYQAMAPCVAAGVGKAGANFCNSHYVVGFYPWQHDSVYARDIDAYTGGLVNTTQCYMMNDIVSPDTYHWDLNKSVALSSTSNTGRDILGAWFNGTNVVYKHSAGNTMSWKNAPGQGEVKIENTVAEEAARIKGTTKPTIVGNRLLLELDQVSSYSIHDLNGKLLQTGTLHHEKYLDLSGLPAGNYIFQTNSDKKVSTKMLFTKL